LSLLAAQTSKEFTREVLSLQPKIRMTVILLLWKWWDVHNKVNAGEQILATDSVLRGVITMSENCLEEYSPRAPVLMTNRRRWCPPGQQAAKINIDGAFSPSSNVGAWGFIVSDECGGVALAGAGNMGQAHDALMVGATACLRALELADQYGISRIELETDSTQLEEAIRTCSRDLGPSGMIFKAIRQLLLRFNLLAFKHLPRSCNSSVHEAAQLVRVWDPGQVHMDG
jgi:ribonuclease HI